MLGRGRHMLAGGLATAQSSDMNESGTGRRSRRRNPYRISTLVVVPLVLLSFVGGLVLALTITAGTSDRGSGAYEGSTELAYWTLAGTFADTMHGALPGAASTTVGTPTVLPASTQSYRINAATIGNAAVRWNFTEGTSSPVNTEIEITFTIAYAISGANSTIKIYLETQGTAPASPLVFQLYYDSGGTGAPGSSAVQAFVQLSQQCAGIGTCP